LWQPRLRGEEVVVEVKWDGAMSLVASPLRSSQEQSDEEYKDKDEMYGKKQPTVLYYTADLEEAYLSLVTYRHDQQLSEQA